MLFAKEWVPNDPMSHGGDGLGPVYNETSCVACHGLGAPGGAGPESKNVVLVTATSTGCGSAAKAAESDPSRLPRHAQRGPPSLRDRPRLWVVAEKASTNPIARGPAERGPRQPTRIPSRVESGRSGSRPCRIAGCSERFAAPEAEPRASI